MLRPATRLRPGRLRLLHERAGHSHGHEHSHGATVGLMLSDSPGARITRIGFYVNVSMAVGKIAGGWAFHSQALMADGFHALSDLLSDLLTLSSLSLAARPPTPAYPLGFGKVETMGAVGVAGLLLFAGLGTGYTSAMQLVAVFGSSSSGGDGAGIAHAVDPNALWLAASSIVVKEWLYRRTIKVARDTHSTVLAANAWHHRVDSLTSVVACVAIGGSYLSSYDWLDAVGGALVSVAVVRAGWQSLRQATLELLDHSIDPDMARAVGESAGKRLGPGMAVDSVVGTKSGPKLLVEVTVAAGDVSLQQATQVQKEVEQAILHEHQQVKKVRVGMVYRI